ncbi:hypothetical protein JXA48_00455 [Candidatus Woesearchaeota archaeon]|nr:hypothetical protein [Candidatus Woesearchaeota archaeon]
MKRVSLILLMLILLSLVVGISEAVEEVKIFDSWCRYDYAFTYDGRNYSIATLATGDQNHPEDGRIAIKAPNGTAIINYGECVETEAYKYCFENVTFEGKYIDIDDNGKTQPGLKLKLIEYDYKADIKIDKWFEKTNFKLYEKGEVAITIENTGDQILKEINVIEKVPEGFEVSAKSNNMIVTDKRTIEAGPLILYPEKTWTGRYIIKAINYTEGTYATQIKYNSEEETGKELTGTNQKIKVDSPYKLTVSEIKPTYDATSPINLNIKLENNEDENLYIEELDIYAPANMYTSSSGLLKSQSNNRYKYSGSINEDEEKTFEVKMTPIYTGKYTISYYIKFNLKGKEYVVSERVPFEINTEGIDCYFETEENDLEAGTSFNMDVVIENDDDENYYEIVGEITNPFGDNIKINKTNLEKGKLFTEELKNIILPITSEDKEYEFEIKTNYRSVDGEEFECESAYPISVKGKDKYIDVSVKAPDQSIRPGSEADLTFFLENLIDKEFDNVYVEYELKDNISSTGFSRKQFDTLEARETKEAYTTKVRIPETWDKDYFEVILKVGARNPKYENSVVVEVPVNTSKEKTETTNQRETNNQGSSDSSTTNSGSNSKSNSEEEGFVDKVINFFVNLFKGNK